MKKVYSLKGKKNFNKVFKSGRRYRGTGLQFIVLKNTNSSGIPDCHNESEDVYPKFAILVNRRFGKAHLRNKTRRRIRAVLQKLLPEICNNVKIVIRVFDDYKELSFEELSGQILHISSKAKILRKDR